MRWTTVLIAVCFAVSASAQEQNADSSDVLENDFSDLVQMKDDLTWRSLDSITNAGDGPDADWLDLRISAPQLASIRPAPVKTFHTQFKKIQRWQLDITASDGSLFRTISGKGSPPSQINWDGKGDNGETLLAGDNYAYTFTAVDKAGNKRTFPGETFSVPAFYLFEDDKLLIGVAGSELFANDILGLKPQTKQYAKEIASLIRYFSKEGQIAVASTNKMAEDFLTLLAEELVCDVAFFSRQQSRPSSASGLKIFVQ
jgi:hypothetical protein